MLKKITLATLLCGLVPAIALADSMVPPFQFMAKQYTEALGRAPDPSGWQAYTNYFKANGCKQSSLSYMASQLFGSTEYANKGYTSQEKVLTVYRAMLSREPDQGGFTNWVNFLNAGNTAAQMAQQLAASTEFASLIGDQNSGICSGRAYRQDWGNSWPLDINSLGIWTDVDLANCVNNNVVCNVPSGKVVKMYHTVTIPSGHTLQTNGTPDRRTYAKQARIVRYSGSFGHLLVAQPGATIQNIWVNGAGNYFLPTDNGVKANIRFESSDVDTSIGVIRNVRSEFPYQLTNIETGIGNGTINITSNLTVGYASHHVRGTTSNYYTWADGISQHVNNGIVQNNDIVDPTDVGIVIFGHTGKMQSNSAASNTIVHAGLSAYGSMGLDTTQCSGAPAVSPPNCAFSTSSGAGLTNNTILAGSTQRVDIMLFNGTAPWKWNTSGCGAGYCGTGGQISNNSTIQNDTSQTVMVEKATVQDAMLNANTQNNTLNVVPNAYGPCYSSPFNCITEIYYY